MKVVFDKENIDPEASGIVLVSHGPLAWASLESAKMIAGEIPSIAALSLEPRDTLDDLSLAIKEVLGALPGTPVVLIDLYGGTPFHAMVFHGLSHQCRTNALCGFNLPMILEAVTLRHQYSGASLLQELMHAAGGTISLLDEAIGQKAAS